MPHPDDIPLETLVQAMHALARRQLTVADGVSREEARERDLGLYAFDGRELDSRRVVLDTDDDEPIPLPEATGEEAGRITRVWLERG